MSFVDRIRILNSQITQLPIAVRILLVVVLTAAFVWLDLVTPAHVVVTGLYLVPLFIAAWYCGVGVTVAVATTSVLVSLYVSGRNFPSSTPFWERVLSDFSIGIVFVAFATLLIYLKSNPGKGEADDDTDALTGISNRSGFLDRLVTERARTARFGHEFSVVLIDIDNLRHLLDTQGKRTRDDLLQAASLSLKNMLRATDVIGRTGEGQFALLLFATNVETSRIVLTRLNHSLSRLINSYDSAIRLFVGAGVILHDSKLSSAEVMTGVDEMLGSIKAGTKDNISIEIL